MPPRICIAGAGAIGCTLAARMAMAGHTVSVLARGDTLAAIRRDGIRLDDLEGRHQVRVAASDAPDFGVQDVVFACAKAHDLAAILPRITPLVGAHTVVVPAVNGVPWWYFHGEGGRFAGRTVQAVDPDGRVSALLPLSHIVGCVVFITAELVAPARVVVRNPQLMMFGEPDNSMSPRLARLCELVAAGGIEVRALERIRDKLWIKVIANLSTNPLSVATGATLEEMYRPGDLQDTVVAIMREALLVAASHGARIDVDPLSFLELGAAMGPVRTSMLQDFEKGRPLELAAIGDTVLEFAAHFDIPMPVTRKVIALARFRGNHAAARPA